MEFTILYNLLKPCFGECANVSFKQVNRIDMFTFIYHVYESISD